MDENKTKIQLFENRSNFETNKYCNPKFCTTILKPVSKLCWNLNCSSPEQTEKLPVKLWQVHPVSWVYGQKLIFFLFHEQYRTKMTISSQISRCSVFPYDCRKKLMTVSSFRFVSCRSQKAIGSQTISVFYYEVATSHSLKKYVSWEGGGGLSTKQTTRLCWGATRSTLKQNKISDIFHVFAFYPWTIFNFFTNYLYFP